MNVVKDVRKCLSLSVHLILIIEKVYFKVWAWHITWSRRKWKYDRMQFARLWHRTLQDELHLRKRVVPKWFCQKIHTLTHKTTPSQRRVRGKERKKETKKYVIEINFKVLESSFVKFVLQILHFLNCTPIIFQSKMSHERNFDLCYITNIVTWNSVEWYTRRKPY
jgi:hypothetical protein